MRSLEEKAQRYHDVEQKEVVDSMNVRGQQGYRDTLRSFM